MRTEQGEAPMDCKRVGRFARSAGLPNLTEKHLEQLAQSIEAARELSQKLPRDLHWSEDLALQFRTPERREPR